MSDLDKPNLFNYDKIYLGIFLKDKYYIKCFDKKTTINQNQLIQIFKKLA